MKRIVTLFALLLWLPLTSWGCTTAVISGKFTKSGRPMIWKVRDTSEYDNHIRRFSSPLGHYIGLINDSDPEGTQIWGGHNSSGFAIMNSASVNVNLDNPIDFKDQEGVIMKMALEQCVTLADFEELLENLERPMGLAAHFGVIDAQGGAAFYEVNNYTWTKFDANEDESGYLLRTNYSYTGVIGKGYGYVRKTTAEALFQEIPMGTLTVEMLGSQLSRTLRHTLLGMDYSQPDFYTAHNYINTDDMITRFATSSMILTEGVAPGEDPEETTSWVHIGQPFVSPLIPVWTWDEVPLALQLPKEGSDNPPTLAQLAKLAKRELYPIRTVEEQRYLYLPFIYNKQKSGVMQKLQLMEHVNISALAKSNGHAEKKQVQSRMIQKGKEILEQAISTSR